MNITKERLIACVEEATETHYDGRGYYAVEMFKYIEPKAFINALNRLQEGQDSGK